MARFKNANWDFKQNADGSIGSWNELHAALFMDIRDELEKLNAVFSCQRFVAIPITLNKIAKNTTKRKRK